MNKRNTYDLPKSLKKNDEFVAFCRFLDKRYLRGAQALLKEGHRNPGEEHARHIAEQLFGIPFPKERPEWLVNEATGCELELDGYNVEKQIAFEYQSGAYHFLDGAAMCRDNFKKKLCKQRGIVLLVIWPDSHTRKLLLNFFEAMAVAGIAPKKPVLWYGCWINRISSREVFSHGWLTRKPAYAH